MPKSTNSVAAHARRKRILDRAKGFWGRRKNVYTVAKNAVERADQYSYRHRKTKKREFRALWIQRINAAARLHELTYSTLMARIKAQNLLLNRKVLADLAMNHPVAFEAVIKKVA